MSRISFAATKGSDWNVDDGALRVTATIDEPDLEQRSETIYFTVPAGFHAHPDLVCIALSTLCGSKYKVIAFDFAGSDQAKSGIEASYNIAVEFHGAAGEARHPGSRMALNFSGGFDSMTALAVTTGLPISLISMDFGGYFARETNYFRTFDTVICSTDLRQKGFHLNDWRFMAVGSILLADVLELGTVGFGTILEASAWNFRGSQRPTPSDDKLFAAAGLVSTSWIRGLTELGTAMAMLALMPDAIVNSLDSLAAPGSEKLLRKRLLVEAAGTMLGQPVPEMGPRVTPAKPVEYGKTFAIDFLAYYFIKRFGLDYVSSFITGIPDDPSLNAIVASDLDFYAKYNPSFLIHMPDEIRNHVLGRLHEAGVYPYTEVDFERFAIVRQYLAKTYPAATPYRPVA
ncbi:MAG: hypothetical protein ACO1OG_10790 [Devosia sp.]